MLENDERVDGIHGRPYPSRCRHMRVQTLPTHHLEFGLTRPLLVVGGVLLARLAWGAAAPYAATLAKIAYLYFKTGMQG